MKFAKLIKCSSKVAVIDARLAWASTAWAQLIPAPNGSPLDPSQQNGASSNSSRSSSSVDTMQSSRPMAIDNPYTNSQSFSPINVNDTGAASLEQQLSSLRRAVNSWSTLTNAVMAAGDPNAGGSFRSIQLVRNGYKVIDSGLYDLFRRGDRNHDTVLQNEDMILILPVGHQLAIIGSINEEDIYEARPNETLLEMLGYDGGTNLLGDKSRAILYSLSDKDVLGNREIGTDQAHATTVAGGDIVQLLSKRSLIAPIERQQVPVRIEGEANKSSNYYVAPNAPMQSAINTTGGLSPRAYPYVTKLLRLSIKAQQREALRQAFDQFELKLDMAPLSSSQLSATSTDKASQHAAVRAVIARLRKNDVDGCLVLPIAYQDTSLPGDILRENDDQIFVPPLLLVVGVFGAFYRSASLLFELNNNECVRNLFERAGGAESSVGKNPIFFIRASREVLTRKRDATNAYLGPDYLVIVLFMTHLTSFLAKGQAISGIIFFIGLTAAAVGMLS